MDRWESSIEDYQSSQTLVSFSSVLKTAENILKEDLAPFEFNWFTQTLFSEPVRLLDTLAARLSDDAWYKAVKDIYKLLSDLVENHYDGVKQYIEAIVLECEKPQYARSRSHALQCLATCVKRAPSAARADIYTAELAQTSTCKAPLALLVGTICEYHPEMVADDINTIWRNYLKLLSSNKNTDLVCSSLLKGVWGLLKHFGADLPVRELTEFYDKLTREYLSKCKSAVLPILRDYASLFKEKLAADAVLRRELWTFDDLSAILPVYEEIGSVLSREQLQKILLTEIVPKTTTSYAKLKFAALRVCVALRTRHGVCVRDVFDVDEYALEFQLRGEASYDVTEAVSWCIESNMANSEKLLQTAIMFYHNLPPNKRKDIVVNGLLNAPTDMKNTTLNFLITESCQDDSSLLSLLPLWRDIFDSQLLDKKEDLFEKYIENILIVIQNFLEDPSDDQKIPDKLATLLSLTSHVLTMQPAEDCTSDQCALVSSKLVDLTRQCGLEACIVAVARSISSHLKNDDGIRMIYEMFQIDKCKDEALLCECCLALIQAPEMTETSVVLKALEIIFSRKDAEPKTLSLATNVLEKIIVKENNNLSEASISKCIQLIEKLRSRKDMLGKDARVLQRDVAIFLGKYLNQCDFNDAVNSEANTFIVKLKDALTLDVPNPIEGTTYHIKMNRLLHLAIVCEHEDSLRMLINIICANLCTNSSPLLQLALGRVLAALCRATVGVSRPDVARHAASFCNVDATLYILQQISEEKSPAVRRVLSDTIESILLKDQGSEANEILLKAVYKEACCMMNSDSPILKLGGLDITESLLTALKVNRRQTKDMLPALMILISKTHEQGSYTVFENTAQIFIENIGLFSASVLDNTITELMKTVLTPEQDMSNAKARIYNNTINSTLRFARKVIEYNNEGSSKIIQIIFDIQSNSDPVKFIYLWSEMPKVFEMKDSEIKEAMDLDNSIVLERFFDEIDVGNNFALDAHLRFMDQNAAVLLKFYSAKCLEHISGIIAKLPSKYVRSNRKHLSKCLTHCRQILKYTPDVILKSFESWTEGLPLKDITEHIEKEKFTSHHASSINALNFMLDIFRLRDPTSVLTTNSIFAKTWATTVLKIFANGHIRYFKKEKPFLSDLLSVSLRFLTVTDVKNILLEGHELPVSMNGNVGIEFTRFFMSVFIKYLVKKPFILLQDGMEPCIVLLHDIVKWCVRKRWHDDQLENVLELVDMLWPAYEFKTTFKAKHSLLLDLSCLNVKLRADSRPMLWATALLSSEEAQRGDRIALVGVLPGGEGYREAYQRYAASLLPTRLSDIKGVSCAALRALLDALTGSADAALLDIVIKLADGDATAGWWDEALISCMASLARLPTLSLAQLVSVHERCSTASTAACQRLLVPLLRYSPTSLCEEFFASILKGMLEGLSTGIKAPSLHPEYRACVQQKTITLDILHVLFEKVPASKIGSPSSALYKNIQTDKTWHLARELIRLCHQLRKKLVPPEGAPSALMHICREFQCSAYKCMCACVCARKPDAHIYSTVFSAAAWDNIVDHTAVYELPLKTEWHQHKFRQSVSIAVTGGGRRARSSSQSRVFLRTLSENPLEYDLIDHKEDDTDTQDVELTDSSLNKHPCAATLTALFLHASGLNHYEWRVALCQALTTSGRNVRLLLAEAVCNCKQEMRVHAVELRPALLAVLADTLQGGLNSLHIDILNTLILWRDDIHLPTPAISNLNSAVNCLVETALNNIARTNIFRMCEEVLENMLKTYGSYIQGDLAVIEESFDDSTRTRSCLKLLLRFAKNNVRVPNLLPLLLTKLANNHKVYRAEITLLAELIGIEISNSNKEEKSTAAARLKKILEDVKQHNISDYVKIMYGSGCCDAQQYRTIVDLTLKLPEADRKKCLRIISTYICEHPELPEATEIPPDIRQMADLITGDRHFEELFTNSSQFLIPAASSKRLKIDASSAILNTIGRNEQHIAEVLSRLADRVGRASQKLCKNDMAVRFVECFYIAIYLPIKYPCGEKPDLSVCMSSFFEMLFSHLKTQQNFRDKKLRDQPLIIEHPIGLSRSRSARIVGTLRSFAFTSNPDTVDETETGIDVQVSIEKILDTFIQFAKVTPEAAMELLTQLLRCLIGRGFDSRPLLSQLLSTLVKVAPEMVVLARECVDQLYLIDGFVQTVEELRRSTTGTEGEQVFRLLNEETKLRCRGADLFTLGTYFKEDEDLSMSEDKEFSIEELTSAFQKLSNWDDRPYQDKRQIESNLPLLWTGRDQFKNLLDEYNDKEGWFGQMVLLYRDNRKDLLKWLRALDGWPRRQFAVSSVTEAMQWNIADHEFDIDILQLPCVIAKSDCLAEWAARLMLRTAYLSDSSEACYKLSRSHELLWCESANERGLHNLALSVINRNCLDLEEDETLQWMEQKMLASSAMGFQRNDSTELEKALNTAKFLPDYYDHSTPEAIIGVNTLVMKINYKLESLSSTKIENVMEVVEKQINRLNTREVTSVKSKKNLSDLYQTAVLYHDGLWDEYENNDEIIVKLCDYLGRLIAMKLDGASVAAIILNRLDECEAINDTAAAYLLSKMKSIISELPTCYLDQLKAKLHLFPDQIVRSCGISELQGEPAVQRYRQCLQLLCDASYLFLQYCDELYRALESGDQVKWDAVFSKVKSRIFENEYAGADFQALVTYQSTFNALSTADPGMKRIVLQSIMHGLKIQARETIRLSHVCPALAGLEPEDGLGKLLRLPAGIQLVNIEEELRVFTDSKQRPCVISVLTSDGKRRRYLHKNEDLRADAAVHNFKTPGNKGYTVIPLSDDCGLIEFLEDHKRIRDLIESTCDINEMQIERQAAKDEELVLAPKSSSVKNYNEICSKIPVYSLRSAIENHSCSVQDFVSKKRRFLETLSDVTIVNWLFGLGDRHLQNLLYSVQDGGVQCIDWGAILQYGKSELPPARLTRNMLAVCDTAVLESRLQALLGSLRESHPFIVPALKLSFKWRENFSEKLIYMEGILQGTMLAHEITKDAIHKSNRPHKMKYIELLDQVFVEHKKKDLYSVEEQVSCLLLQCTEPWILSVTRTGWEPWL